MEKKIIIAHARDEDYAADKLAKALVQYGYTVVHCGTLFVGDSPIREFNRFLSQRYPVIFLGTCKAVGSNWASKIIEAAETKRLKVFPIRIDEDARLDLVFSDERVIANCTPSHFEAGIQDVRSSLDAFFAAEEHSTELESEEILQPTTFLERLTAETNYNEYVVTRYRERLRDDIRKKHPDKETNKTFLKNTGFLVNNKMTLAGVLLFGNQPNRYSPMAIIKCSKYNVNDKAMATAIKKADYDGPIHQQIDDALEFVRLNIDRIEMQSLGKAEQEVKYQYPMECVEEIVSNAVCHRDYAVKDQAIKLRVFSDRMEIGSPGSWYSPLEGNKPLDENKEYLLEELQTEAKQRNPMLAQAIYAIWLSEGRAEGIPRAIKDCKANKARMPTVLQKDGMVYATIYPREDWGREIEAEAARIRPTLREVLKSHESCWRRFEEAEGLAISLFRRGDSLPLPYFTPHDASHCKAVEEYLNQIIWGTEGQPVTLSEYDFVPTPEEAMYLLSAAWLHDIGMMYGIFKGEMPGDLAGDTARVMKLREEHEMRTVKYIHDEWKLFPWDDYQKTLLSVVCKYHRRRHPIATFDPARRVSRYDGRPIRLVVLAALLRLADACHEDQSRAPGSLMALYRSLGMTENASVHWERAKLIPAVHFDHTNRRITLTGCCLPKFDFGLGEFDLAEIIDIVREDIEEELRSVQQILLRYPNVYFGEVTAEIFPPFEIDEEKQYLAVWPYLLDKPRDSTEAAAALAQMLLFAVKEREETGDLGKAWQDSILFPIMNKTQESRPGDFMIRNLCQRVKDILLKHPSNEELAKRLIRYLEGFLKEMSENCQKIAEFASDLVGANDVVVVHGYCRNIAEFLRNLEEKCGNTLYIADYQEPIAKVQLGPSENQRMVTFAGELGFGKVRLVSLAALTQALAELKQKRIPCKVLLDTHGVLKTKGFLCKVGSCTIANTAKEFGAQVIAFAEETKFLIDGESDEELASPEKLFSSDWMCVRHPTMIDAMCLTPEIDLVRRELVDLVLTEKGAFPPDSIPTPAAKLINKRASEKKESNPT